MTKQNLHGKRNVAVGGRKTDSSLRWYFLRLAFLTILWEKRNRKNPDGILVKQCYLLRAKNVKSVINKALYILSSRERLQEGGRLNGKKAVFKKIGILDIEPLLESLESQGPVDIFDESETNVSYRKAMAQVMSNRGIARRVKYEIDHGKLDPVTVNWGKEFNRL